MPVDFKRPETWSKPVAGIQYVTTTEIDWGLFHPQSTRRLIIAPGRVFDVSIPTYLRWAFDPHDPRYRIAGLVHDVLLEEAKATRIRAGGEFHDALRAGGTPVWRALLMWLAVSVFRYPLYTTTPQ